MNFSSQDSQDSYSWPGWFRNSRIKVRSRIKKGECLICHTTVNSSLWKNLCLGVPSPIGNMENFEHNENWCHDRRRTWRFGAILQKMETANIGNTFTEMLVSDDPEIIMEKFTFSPQNAVESWSNYSVWKLCYYCKFVGGSVLLRRLLEDFPSECLDSNFSLEIYHVQKCFQIQNIYRYATMILMDHVQWTICSWPMVKFFRPLLRGSWMLYNVS